MIPASRIRSVAGVLVKDGCTHKYALFALLLALLTTLVVLAFYLNHPGPEPLADTWSYLYVVDRIQAHAQPVNPWRLPGYPLFIALVYLLVGQGNLAAVSVAQAVLFVLATLEVYVLAALILRRAWAAFLIGLLVGANLILLSYVKPIMSEPFSLWLLVSLALAVVLFLHTPRAGRLWLVTAWMLLLLMTRPEWMYLPVVLFAYLLLVALWRGLARPLLPHLLASLVLLYAVLGGYIFINATQNHFNGVTYLNNITALGKVLQYHMQDEAPQQYASFSRTLDRYVAKGQLDPYPILAREPSLSRNYDVPAGEFSQSIIEHHPLEFLVKSVPVFFSSLTVFRQESAVDAAGAFGSLLTRLKSKFRALYAWNILFLPCALAWLLLLLWRRTRYLQVVQMMGALVLLILYALIITTLGSYREVDTMRVHTIFDPLIILVIWGTLLLGALLVIQEALKRWKKPLTGEQLTAGVPGDMTNARSLFRYVLVLLALLAMALSSSSAWQTSHGPTNLLPALCHREPIVGLLFITIENRGNDAGPSTTTVAFDTNLPQVQRVQLQVNTPGIPSGTDIWVAVELPTVPGTAGFLIPPGKVTITADAGKVLPETNRKNSVIVTGCNDAT